MTDEDVQRIAKAVVEELRKPVWPSPFQHTVYYPSHDPLGCPQNCTQEYSSIYGGPRER